MAPPSPADGAGGGPAVRPIEVPYELLVGTGDEACARRVDALIEEAFGPDGLGLVTISGVPGFVEARQRLLPLAAKLAALPPAALAALERPCSRYSVGWSHGKEELLPGRPDVHKGSFYANPTTDAPAEDDATVTEEDAARYPGYYSGNVWPRGGGSSSGSGSSSGNGNGNGSSASLPELEPAFKALGRIVVNAGLLLAERCDAYVKRAWERRYGGEASQQQQQQQPPAPLAHALRSSRCHKARLLHYFPPGAGAGVVAATAQAAAAAAAAAASAQSGGGDGGGGAAAAKTAVTTAADNAADANAANTNADDEEDADGWCGWHRDHGALTGLTCAMYTRPSATRAPRFSCADDAHGVAAFVGGGQGPEEEGDGGGPASPPPNPSPRPASPPDARAGLYVRTRSGRAARAEIPADHLAFQVGQAAAIMSHGLLCATPHCVRAPSVAGVAAGGGGGGSESDVSRETFAVFLQPDVRAPLSVPLPPPALVAAGAAAGAAAAGDVAVASLALPGRALAALFQELSTADSGQYRPGDSFGDFAERTVRGNYGGEQAAGGKPAGGGVGGVGGGPLQLGARAGGGRDDDAANEADSPGGGGAGRQDAAAVYVVHE